MENIKEIIIIGGGKSIQEGLSLGLKDKIKDKCVLSCNYAYKDFNTTVLCFLDRFFYIPVSERLPDYRGQNPDIYEELKTLPLILTHTSAQVPEKYILSNTFVLKKPYQLNMSTYFLTGQFALDIADYLTPEKIFLLGFDWTRQTTNPWDKTHYNEKSNIETHYYDKKTLNHRGVGFTGYYDRHAPNELFKYFTHSHAKIYNVSLISNIKEFEKINYQTMFELLSDINYNQDELRTYIRRKLCIK